MAQSRLQHVRNERLNKIQQLQDLGINPYPAQSQKDLSNNHIIDNFDELQGQTYTVAGRLTNFRTHGKVAFADIQDITGKIQLFLRSDILDKTNKSNQTLGFDHLNLIDAGDFIQATGEVTKTKTGQVSVLVKQFKLLDKSIRPLTSKTDVLKDPETKFRRRYLDLTTNSQQQQLFLRKSKFWQVQRRFLQDRGFIEVEVPTLEHVTGGADARPFTTHMNALDQEFFLRISTELYQKRLIGGGFEKIYTLGPNFRNEGLSDEHLPEYYQLEWYWAYADYRDNMQLVKELYTHTAKEVYGKTQFTTRGHTFDLSHDWEEIDYTSVIQEKLGVDIFNDSEDKMLQVIKDHNVKLPGGVNKARLVDNLWKIIRKSVSGPAFLINTPKFISPLAKSLQSNPQLTERFQVILAGSELGNGYSELNDPLDQLERFREQQGAREAGDDEAQMLDIDFVEMLEYGMPPTSGWGHSERLFWYLEDVTAREGTLFPALKHKIEPVTQKIYNIKPIVKKEIVPNDYLNLSAEFIAKYPSASAGFAVIENVGVTKSNPDLDSEIKSVLDAYKDLNVEDIGNYSEIDSYRQMYKNMGIDWHSRRPSPEALLRRLAQGKGLYNINTCVDAYNMIVIKNRISAGAFNLDNMQLPSSIKIAQGVESTKFLGKDTETKIKKGEVCYFDQIGPYNIDYNYRDAERTMITEDVKNLFINVEGIYSITPEQVETNLNEVVDAITKYCGGNVTTKGMVTKSGVNYLVKPKTE